MSKRVVIFIGLIALVAAPSYAVSPFGRIKKKKRSDAARLQTRSSRIPLHILKSPEKMTERFGPSVLIREPVSEEKTNAKAKKSNFVTQP